MNFIDTLNRLGFIVTEPQTPPTEYVGSVVSLGRHTLAESERVIRENPELAKAMGVEVAS